MVAQCFTIRIFAVEWGYFFTRIFHLAAFIERVLTLCNFTSWRLRKMPMYLLATRLARASVSIKLLQKFTIRKILENYGQCSLKNWKWVVIVDKELTKALQSVLIFALKG